MLEHRGRVVIQDAGEPLDEVPTEEAMREVLRDAFVLCGERVEGQARITVHARSEGCGWRRGERGGWMALSMLCADVALGPHPAHRSARRG